MEKEGKIVSLFEKYISGTISEEENVALCEIIACYPGEELSGILAHFTIGMHSDDTASKVYWDSIVANVLEQATLRNDQSPNKWEVVSVKHEDVITPVRRIPLYRRWSAVAAAVLIFAVAGVYHLLSNKEQQPLVSDNKHLLTDIPLGKEGAILTLADGSQVVLDSLSDGLVAAQNGSQVSLKSGQIAYEATGNISAEMEYNTMSTPKGRQFRVTLPDGTKVWLNAASSIRYPTVFTGKERKVYVTGEAYFEVTQNSKTPFRVVVNNIAEIDVLGTGFNINAYENEEMMQTTLLNGSVKVNGKIIKPGQQAQLFAISASANHSLYSDQVNVVNVNDINKVMAWKNGVINFDGIAFDEIMRQLERWYDIEVVYENNKVPNRRLAGEMTRDVPLSGVLEHLKNIGVNFRIEAENRLVILP